MYDWNTLHPFQRRSFRRFPQNAELIPEIQSFGPLESYDKGIKDGKIELINGTVLEGIDEVSSPRNGSNNHSHIHVLLDHPRHGISKDQPIPGTSLERVSVPHKLSRAYEH